MAKRKEKKAAPPAKDRRNSLIALGVLDIGLGLLFALMIPLTFFSYSAGQSTGASGAPALTLKAALIACSVYLSISALFLWAGVGLCLCRRWARSVVLALSWIAFVYGLGGFAFTVWNLPSMLAGMADKPGMTEGIIAVTKWAVLLGLFFFYVFVPGIHALVLGHPNVRDTCRYRDPETRWTDAVPMQVLVLVLMTGFGALTSLFLLYYPTVPIFGYVITGLPAVCAALGLSLLMAYLTRELYRLKERAWWISTSLTVGWFLSSAVTFSRYSFQELYAMNLSAEELEAVRQQPMLQGDGFLYYMGASVLAAFGYQLYCKRYFEAPPRKRVRRS